LALEVLEYLQVEMQQETMDQIQFCLELEFLLLQ